MLHSGFVHIARVYALPVRLYTEFLNEGGGLLRSNMDVLQYGGLEVNPLEQTVYYLGQEIIFTNREFQVLYLLLKYRGQVFSKRQIYEQITDDEDRTDYHTIEITISRTRKNLETYLGHADVIVTVRGRGYKIKKQI